MAILERWCTDDRRVALAVIFEDEDRRSIQAILRGAQQGTATEARMAGLVPTTSLPERALLTLAAQPTPTDVIRMLALWNHPLGTPLVAAASGPHPSLFEIEVELQRAFARRASARAQLGGSQVVEYVEQLVDVMNTWSALLHFVERDPAIVDMTFVEGGRWITRDVFHKLMLLETRPQVEKRLAWELRRSALASALRGDIENLAQLENRMLRAQIDWQKRMVRVDPSGAAPIIGFAIELRAEVVNLRSIIWGVALQAPAALIHSSPGLSAGFALAGVPVFEATDGADAARQIDHLPDAMNVGVILIDEPLYEDLPEEVRRDLRRAPVPVVIPVPGPDWTTETTAHEYIVELLRRAIGYRVRLQ
jgi:vacuolar-type H+-ATPase subunit F/Vma7